MKIDSAAQRLGIAVKAKRKRLNLSLETAAAETGVSASTISRVESGRKCDAATMNALAGWVGIPVDRLFAVAEIGGGAAVVYFPEEPLPDVVEAHLLKDKTLTPENARALAEVFRAAYDQFVDFKKK